MQTIRKNAQTLLVLRELARGTVHGSAQTDCQIVSFTDIVYVKGSVIGETYLSLAERPEIHHQADAVVDGRVGGLVEQRGRERAERVQHQPGLDAAVQRGPREWLERPLPSEGEEAEEQIDDLQDGEGLDGAVEVLGQEIPEDLGPEEAFERGGALVGGGCQDDEARPVVLDELAHFWGGGVVVSERERARLTKCFLRWRQ